MGTVIDPYHEWLAIPPGEQPPNHYRLLGIPLFTDDPHVIAHAAHQRFADIRSKESGEHALLSQRIFDEIVVAEACLLNPESKGAYDAKLRRQFPVTQQQSQADVPLYLPLGKQRPKTLPSLPSLASPLPPVAPPVQDATQQDKRHTNWNYVGKRRWSTWKVAIGSAGFLVVIAIGLLLGYDSLPPAIQTISRQFLPPVLLATIFALLSLYVGLLLPAGRRWIARRGRWGAALVGQTECKAVEGGAVDRRDDATFQQLIRETSFAFAILSAVLIFVFVESLALMVTQGSAGPSTDLTPAIAKGSSDESPVITKTKSQETSPDQKTEEISRDTTDRETPELAEPQESSKTEVRLQSSEDPTLPVSAEEKPLADSSESSVTEVHAESSEEQTLPANGDEVATAIQVARKQHEEVVNRAKAGLNRAIDGLIEKSAASGNLDRVIALKAEKQTFNSNGSLPTYSLLRKAVDAYKESCLTSYAEVISTYEKAVLAYTESLEVEKARVARSETFRLIHQAKRLYPEFRSDPDAHKTVLKEAMNELLTTRIWKDLNGRKIKAKFVRIRETGVVVLRRNNSLPSLQFNQFSMSDQELLRRGLEYKGKHGILPPASSLVVNSKQRVWTDHKGRKIEGRVLRVSSDDDPLALIEIVPDEDQSRFLHVIQARYKNLSSIDQEYIRATLSPVDAERFLPAEAATPVEDGPELVAKNDPEPAEDILSKKPDAADKTPLDQEEPNDDPPQVAISDDADRFGQDDADNSENSSARRRLRREGEQKTYAAGSRLADQRTAIEWDTYWMAYVALLTFLIFVTVMVCRGFLR